MKTLLESLYSKIVSTPVETLKRIKPIGISWFTQGTKE